MKRKQTTRYICTLMVLFLLFTGIGLDYTSAADSLFVCQKNSSSSTASSDTFFLRKSSSPQQDLYIREDSHISQFIHFTKLSERAPKLIGIAEFSLASPAVSFGDSSLYFQDALSGAVFIRLSHRVITAYLHAQDGSKR